MPRTTRIAVALAATLFLLAPTASAKYAAGSIVDKNDDDFTPVGSIKASKLCYLDINGDGKPSMGEPIYLVKRAACDSAQGKDLRLVPYLGFPAGTILSDVMEPEWGVKLTNIPAASHAIRVGDFEPDAKLKKKDTAYIALSAIETKRVNVGDIRLTPFGAYPAGTRVQNGDADQNSPTIDLPACGAGTKTVETASIIQEIGKGTYVNIDCDAAGGFVEEGDIRLTNDVPSFTNDIGADAGRVAVTELKMPVTVAPGAPIALSAKVGNAAAFTATPWFEIALDDVIVDTRAGPLLLPAAKAPFAMVVTAPTTPGVHVLRVGDSSVVFTVVATKEATKVVQAGAEPAPATPVAAKALVPQAQAGKQAPVPVTLVLVALLGALAILRRRTA